MQIQDYNHETRQSLINFVKMDIRLFKIFCILGLLISVYFGLGPYILPLGALAPQLYSFYSLYGVTAFFLYIGVAAFLLYIGVFEILYIFKYKYYSKILSLVVSGALSYVVILIAALLYLAKYDSELQNNLFLGLFVTALYCIGYAIPVLTYFVTSLRLLKKLQK